MKLKTQALSLLILFSLTACINITNLEDAKTSNYDAEFAIPLINSRVTIQNFVDATESMNELQIDEEGNIFFIYEGSETRRNGQEVFQIQADLFPPFVELFSPETRISFAIVNGVLLDQLNVKAGHFIFSFQNPNPEKVFVSFEFTTLLKDGVPLQYKFEIPASTGSNNHPIFTNMTAPADISGYQLSPEDNRAILRYSAKNENGEELPLINGYIQLIDLGFSYAEGYFGPYLLEGFKDSISIDFFEDYSNEQIEFADPTVFLEVENSFGVPTRAVVNELKVTDRTGQQKGLSGSRIDDGLYFPYPPQTAIGSSEKTSFEFNKTNSNIVDLLSDNPSGMFYDLDIEINPEGDPDLKGFITDSSFYSLRLKVQLPLYGSSTNYVVNDTLDFNLEDIENIKKATFKIITENELGVDVNVQAYFLDNQNNILETLFTNQTLLAQGAIVDNNGLTNNPAITSNFVEKDATQIDRIKQASKIALEVGFSTQSNKPNAVRIISTQGVRVKIGAILNVISG
jgi:hypothetical protein